MRVENSENLICVKPHPFVLVQFPLAHNANLLGLKVLVDPVDRALVPVVSIGCATQRWQVCILNRQQLVGDLGGTQIFKLEIAQKAHPKAGDLVNGKVSQKSVAELIE